MPQTPAPPPFPTRPSVPVKPGAPVGLIVGIMIAALLGVLALGALGFFAFGLFSAGKSGVTDVKSTPIEKPAETGLPATAEDEKPVKTKELPPVEDSKLGEYVVVTEAEARDVVSTFITLRAKKDIEGSKALCTAKMLKGPDGDFVNDPYWNPDSFKIVKVTPDQMYMHVASMGMWPSGEEPTIFQVFREPESGKVLIDGFLDPEVSPDLWKP